MMVNKDGLITNLYVGSNEKRRSKYSLLAKIDLILAGLVAVAVCVKIVRFAFGM